MECTPRPNLARVSPRALGDRWFRERRCAPPRRAVRFLVATAALGAHVAVTETAASPAPPPASPTSSSHANDEDVARTLVRRAKASFDAGHYAEAADLLRDAYAINPTSAIAYNLARACARAGLHGCARDAYVEFLRLEPEAPERADVTRAIAELEAKLAAEHSKEGARPAASGSSAPPPRGPETEPGRARRQARAASDNALPWIATGIGAAIAVTGFGLGFAATREHDAAVEDEDAASARGRQRTAEGLAIAANVTVTAGATIAVAGLVWVLLRATDRPSSPALVRASFVRW